MKGRDSCKGVDGGLADSFGHGIALLQFTGRGDDDILQPALTLPD